MGFSNTNGLPRIQSYEEAVRVYHNIKPIRGTTCRPLGKRNAKHYAIEKRGDIYECMLYGHPVITFSRDDYGRGMATVNMCGYDTVTTRGFISRILGTDCYSHKGKTYIEIGKRATQDPETGKYKVTGAYYLPAHYPLQFKVGECINPIPAMKKVLDREVTKQLRDEFKDSMADAEAMLRLGMARYSSGDGMSDGGYSPSERESYFRKQFLIDLTKEEMTEYLWLVSSTLMQGRWWHNNKLQYNVNTQKYEEVFRRNPPYRTYIVDALYHIARGDAIQTHKEVEVPIGQRA
jgi:hypothetical protein